jgi:hypothetical protein
MNQDRKTALQEMLKQYLIWLAQIDAIKQELQSILEQSITIPGVNKRSFKSIATALHQAPGSIKERLAAMDDFILLAFTPGNNREEQNIELAFTREEEI